MTTAAQNLNDVANKPTAFANIKQIDYDGNGRRRVGDARGGGCQYRRGARRYAEQSRQSLEDVISKIKARLLAARVSRVRTSAPFTAGTVALDLSDRQAQH